MLTAYLDESGTHDRNNLCVVAGYVGNDAQWQRFIPDWMSALQRPHRNLHMREFKWNHKNAGEILARLGSIPDRYNLQRVVGGIWMSDYRSIVLGKLRKDFTTPFMWCAQICIATIMQHIAKDEEIIFIFDKNEGSERALATLKKVVFEDSIPDSRVRDIVLTPQKKTVCLDPADFLAFQVREHKSFPDSKKAKLGMSILGNGSALGHIIEADQLRKSVDVLIKKGMAQDNSSPDTSLTSRLKSQAPKDQSA